MKFQGGTGVGLIQSVLITQPATTNTGPNGIPLTVNEIYGLNTNGYFFGRGGFATDNPYYNSIESLQGGVTASLLYSSTLYPAGTVTTTGPLVTPTYLGGFICTGHSIGPPAPGNIGTVTNPLVPGFGLVQGIIYFEDSTNLLTYYNGTSWVSVLSGSLGSDKDVLFNKAGAVSGNNNLEYNYSVSQLTLLDLNISGADNASGITSPYFSGSVTRLSNTPIYTFGNSDGSWSADYQGNLAAQTYKATTTFNSLQSTSGSSFQTSNNKFYVDGLGNLSVTQQVACGWINLIGSVSAPATAGVGLANIYYDTVGDQLLVSYSTGAYTGLVSTVFNSTSSTSAASFQTSNSKFYADGLGNLSLSAQMSCYQLHFFQEAAPSKAPLNEAIIYMDSTTHVLMATVNNNAAVALIGSGGGSPGGPSTSLQINNAGSFIGYSTLEWNNSTLALVINSSSFLSGSGVIAPTFSSVADTAGTPSTAHAFQTSGGNFIVYGNGSITGQSLNVSGSIIGQSLTLGSYGINSSGVATLTGISCTSIAASSGPSTFGGNLTISSGSLTISSGAASIFGGVSCGQVICSGLVESGTSSGGGYVCNAHIGVTTSLAAAIAAGYNVNGGIITI